MAARQYGRTREEAILQNIIGPIPRFRFAELYEKGDSPSDGGLSLADEIVRVFTLRKAQMAPRGVFDLRMLRYMDPERMEDQWQNWLTGAPLSKLYHSGGLAVEMFQWVAAIVEAGVGLLAGNKPMAYTLDVIPADPDSEAEIMRADFTEKYIYREQDDQNYPITYQDGIAYLFGLGRRWTSVSVHPKTRRLRTEIHWPGNMVAFFQRDQRTIEQVYMVQELSLGEAVDLYPERKDDIINATHRGKRIQDSVIADVFSNQSMVTLINCWYRLGSWGDEKIGMATVLLGADTTARKQESTNLLLDYDDDTKYPDIPARCTPRFKIIDKNVDEAAGAIQLVAGLQTDFNETFSAYRDMIWRAIYQRYKAKGFTYRNAPRLIPGTNIYPLPRQDQDIQRLDEVLNTVPIEQVLARQEKMMTVLPGLNNYFLGISPPSETSGEAISAGIHASITRLEPIRTNVQADEIWMYRMWLALAEEYGEYTDDQGKAVTVKSITGGLRSVVLGWRDVSPKDAVKAKQLAIAANAAGLISQDTARDEWDILSKPDEVRKIARERGDPVSNPQHVTQTAGALIQMAQAKMALKQGGGGPQRQPPKVSVSLTGQMSPPEVQSAAEMAGIQGPPPAAAAGGPGGPVPAQPGAGNFGRTQAGVNEMSATAAAQGAAPSFEGDNTPGGGGTLPPTMPGQPANAGAPAPGETPPGQGPLL